MESDAGAMAPVTDKSRLSTGVAGLDALTSRASGSMNFPPLERS
jgi:hypothetical protein